MLKVPKIVVDAVEEPISLETARNHLNLDAYDSPASHPHDPLILSLITSARETAEKFTGRTLVTKTLELQLDCFPSGFMWSTGWMTAIKLPGAPVQQVALLRYKDGSGAEVALTDYQLDAQQDPPRLLPAPNTCWPETERGRVNAVRIRYVAGYTLPLESPSYETLPKPIVQALLLMVGHWYANREDSSMVELKPIPMGSERLLRPYRIEKAMA